MKTLRESLAEDIATNREKANTDAMRESGLPVSEFDWYDKAMSFKKLKESAIRMREATSASAMGQLLRAGVSNYMFDAYQIAAVTWPDLCTSQPSTRSEEIYAPLYNSEVPTEIAQGGQEPFPDSRIQGIDVHVRNRKFGRRISFDVDLIDDDQTGQIQQRAANLGRMMAYAEEITCYTELINAQDPAAQGTPGNGYTTAIGNTPAVPGQLSQPALETAHIALQNMKDPLGNFMIVEDGVVVASPSDHFNILKLLNSTLQPSVPGSAGLTANTAVSGTTGWTMTNNPLQGMFSATISRFMPGLAGQGGPTATLTGPGLDGSHGAWFLMQAKVSWLFQDRQALEIVQEAPYSGSSFSFDVYQYRVKRRFATRVLEPRFIFRGN